MQLPQTYTNYLISSSVQLKWELTGRGREHLECGRWVVSTGPTANFSPGAPKMVNSAMIAVLVPEI